MPGVFQKFKESRFAKGLIYAIVGACSYPGLNIINKLEINGMEKLKNLPKQNVLFVSNHQTYFADVITFIHIFCAVYWRKKHKLGIPYYLLWPFTRIKYVAAEETMKSTWISRLFCVAGAVTVRRTWREDGQEIRRSLDTSDVRKIENALAKNWVITFPQGTTKPFAPGRKGTAFIIKQHRPVVIPVVITGFWRAFNKKGLKLKKRGTLLSVTFKDPMVIDYEDSCENILEQVMDAIEQSKKYMIKGRHHLISTMDK
ncbi:MAG: lysophospholipid acyltransferase family protein [Ferruginibacter sp.]